METVIKNVNSSACGCICEDLSVWIANDTIVAVDGACERCAERLVGQSNCAYEPTELTGAVEILASSRAPLIYGLEGSTVETQRAAIELAESLGATIDPALTSYHRAALLSVATSGISTCTLGEVKQRADVILFWGADPTVTHPLFFSRFIDCPGQFVSGRRCIVHVGPKAPAHRCDEYLEVNPDEDLYWLSALCAIVKGVELGRELHHAEALRRLATMLQQAEYSVIYFGPSIRGFPEAEALVRMVRQLNIWSRCSAIGLGGVQCENVLTWQTGYPCCVNFALGYPRFDPLRYSANSLLERGEVDSVLLVGSEGLAYLSETARQRLAHLPVVLLDPPANAGLDSAMVRIVTAQPGVHCGGTVFRMDGVPIRLRPIFDSPLPDPTSVLTAIRQGVCASCD